MAKKIKKTEVCQICNNFIYLEIDNYVQVKDYRNGKFIKEGFYHTKCFLDRINKGTPVQQMALSLGKRTQKLLDRVEGKQGEEYIIK